MDEVDQKQQEEIESLKRKDVAHDISLWWVRFAFKFVAWIFILWVALSTTLIFVLIDKLNLSKIP